MLDISDAEDAYLSGHAEFMEWHAEFMAQWFKPLGDTLLRALWDSLTPEQHAALEAMSPEAHAVFEQMVMGGNNAGTALR